MILRSKSCSYSLRHEERSALKSERAEIAVLGSSAGATPRIKIRACLRLDLPADNGRFNFHPAAARRLWI